MNDDCDVECITTGDPPALVCEDETDENEELGDSQEDVPCNGLDDDANAATSDGTAAQCADPCGTDGMPVDLATRQMYIGPHKIATINSDLGGSATLSFDILYDSVRASEDYADDVASRAEAQQRPYQRVLGPGFRHTYLDRLILKGSDPDDPDYVIWEALKGTTRLFRDDSTGASFQSEPGSGHRLRKLDRTWRLLVDGGDVLEFVESNATMLHPATTEEKHVRLKAVYPGGALNRKILLLYEDDTQDASSPFIVDQIPGAACTGLVGGDASGSLANCTASRGLLVKLGTVLDDAYHGTSFELTYTLDAAGTNQRDQYLLSAIKSGTDRIDGESLSTFATFAYKTSAYPQRLEKPLSKLFCSSSNDSCAIAVYSYDSSRMWPIVAVERPAVTTTGTLTLIKQEEFTWTTASGKELVATHSSPGITMSTSSSPYSSVMQWTRNGVLEETHFDVDGNVTQCSAGTCGDPLTTRQHQPSDIFLGYTRGVSVIPGADGVWTFRKLREDGLVELICEVVEGTSGTPSCSLSDGDATNGQTVTIANGTMRRLERRYYDGERRLRVSATYSPDESVTSGWKFPHDDDSVVNWETSTTLSGACPSLTTKRTFASVDHFYDVTVYDYNSNGDTTINDVSSTELETRPDMLVVRTNRRAETATSAATGVCNVFERNARGDITRHRKYSGTTLVEQSDTAFLAVPSTKARDSGRADTVTRYRTVGGSPGNTLVVLDACTSDPYADDGRLVCVNFPQASGTPALSSSLSRSSGDGVSAETWTRTTTSGTSSASTIERRLAWGPIYESNAISGNKTRSTFFGSGTAAAALTPSSTKRLTSTNAQISRRVLGRDSYGKWSSDESFNAADTLSLKKTRTSSARDLTSEINEGNSLAITTYDSYTLWDALETMTEADGTVVDYVYGTSGDEMGRLKDVKRATVVEQRFEYTRDGLTEKIFNVPLSSATAIAKYSHDALRRVTKEERTTAGECVTYTYADDVRVKQRTVLTSNCSTNKSRATSEYDGLGRLLSVKDLSNALRRVLAWDTKGSFVGSYIVSGRTIVLSDSYQAGRLAYEEGDAWATFYEYDFLGRVKAIVHHDGALSSFAGANLSAIDFNYATSAGRELTSITYPSGRVVTYTYGADKEWPTAVDGGSGVGTVVDTATYFPTGALASFKWVGTGPRTVTRDLIGRITNIEDRSSAGGTILTDVTYVYDADGDVTSESAAESTKTWLRAATTGNQSRSYGYATNKDILSSWSDDGTTESLTYGSDGRRSSETAGSQTFTYAFDGTHAERLSSKTLTGTVSTREVIVAYESNRARIKDIDWGADHTNDVSIAYGSLDDVTSFTTSAGTYSNTYDAQQRRVKLTEPTSKVRSWRYAFGRAPLEEKYLSSSTFTYETVYLGGEPVAQIARENSGSPTTHLLFTDRMGTPRKTATTSFTITRRVVVDAWGGSNTAGVIIDATVSPEPSLGWRYPGQFADAGGLVNNGWRTLVPDIGQYTSAEPLHFSTAQRFDGPQAYAYAAARPLTHIDPTGKNIPPTSCHLPGGALRPECLADDIAGPQTPIPGFPGNAPRPIPVPPPHPGFLCLLFGIGCPEPPGPPPEQQCSVPPNTGPIGAPGSEERKRWANKRYDECIDRKLDAGVPIDQAIDDCTTNWIRDVNRSNPE